MSRPTLRAAVLVALLAGATGLAGCSNFRDLFTAHADVAAEAGGMELEAERLAKILAGARGRQRVSREAAEFVAGTWVDYALFARAAAQGALPTDSASMAQALWPELSELKGTHFHDTLMARRASYSDSAAADSLYRDPNLRLFQHILFGVRPNAESASRGATLRKAEGTLTRLRRGADFDALAAQLSEDPGSRADSGYLPPGPRGRFVAAFDSAGWALGPGETSGLVETPFGYHIIRRPPLSEARDRLSSYLEERAGVLLDSLYMDSLAVANEIEVLDGAPATMRAAAESPEESRRSTEKLTRFTGGGLTVADYLRWVRALPPQYGAQLRSANDSMLKQFARVLSQNMLLLREADSAGIRITADEWADLRSRYLATLDTLKREMGLDASEFSDSAVSAADRDRLAELKVEQYFDGLVDGKIRLRPLPSALATLMRDRMPHRIYSAGVNRAVESAQILRARVDSLAGSRSMRPAPGPAPVPGGALPDSQPAGGGQTQP